MAPISFVDAALTSEKQKSYLRRAVAILHVAARTGVVLPKGESPRDFLIDFLDSLGMDYQQVEAAYKDG